MRLNVFFLENVVARENYWFNIRFASTQPHYSEIIVDKSR